MKWWDYEVRGLQDADGVSRFACIWKGYVEVRKGSLLEFSMNSSEESDCMIFQSSAEDEIRPGENILTLVAKV